jgi:hypothetical protein
MHRLLMITLLLLACDRSLGPSTGWGVGVPDGSAPAGGPSKRTDDREAADPMPTSGAPDAGSPAVVAVRDAASEAASGASPPPRVAPEMGGGAGDAAPDAPVDAAPGSFAPPVDTRADAHVDLVPDGSGDTGDADPCPEVGRCD